jgi:CubicO group peptidase (beta-lactamase class C family)
MFIACVFAFGCSKPNITEQYEQAEIINEEVAKLISNSKISAVSLAFVTEGVMSTYHYGEFYDGSNPSDNTIFDIGSITKTHVGLILAQAVTDGLIELDAPISRYLNTINKEALQYQGAEITVRHLATHMSGLPTDLSCNESNLFPDERLKCFIANNDENLVKILNGYKLQEKPGSKYRYSNSGIRIIGIILEVLYNAPIEQLLQRFVFKSTGQRETFAHFSENEHARWRRGINENGFPTPDASDYFNAAGGLKSTVPDMGRYLTYYLNNNKIAKKALTLLAGDENGLGRAYIWNTFRLDSEGQYYQGGGTFGTSAWVSIYPRERLAIFLVTPYVSETTQEQLNITANKIIEKYRHR